MSDELRRSLDLNTEMTALAFLHNNRNLATCVFCQEPAEVYPDDSVGDLLCHKHGGEHQRSPVRNLGEAEVRMEVRSMSDLHQAAMVRRARAILEEIRRTGR
jgi:hypothetical protein